MTETTYTCETVDALLPDYLEGSLDAATAAALEAHRAGCQRCAALISDLAAIARDARALPDLVPPRDLWEGIQARIEAPVVELHATRRARRWTRVRLAAAAAALVLTTASVTYVATRRAMGIDVAQGTPNAGSSIVASAESLAGPTRRSRVPSPESQVPSARPASRVTRPATAEDTYDQEIARLRGLVNERRGQLDTGTIAVIERNLRVIDRAIAQSRAALARDPASRFLNEQLNNALDKKVELLRTVAFLPARS